MGAMISRPKLAGLMAFAVLGIVGVAGVAQQAIRQGANHPQIEMAQAAVTRLNAGASPSAVVPATHVDLGSSPDAYLIVVDGQYSVLASSATLNGQVVVPPPGVFDYVRTHGEDRITWQPAPDARTAIVVDEFRGGFVVAGRSLSDTERTEDLLTFWGGLAALGLAVVGVVGLVLIR